MAANGEPLSSRQQVGEEEDAENNVPTETTPLIGRQDDVAESSEQGEPTGGARGSAISLLRSLRGDPKAARWRWPSFLALLILCMIIVLIMVFAFFTPNIVERYTREAAVFEPESLSINSFTSNGVIARIQGDFMMDASRVKKKPIRDLGRAATWIAGAIESGESEVEVSLPEYGNVVLGTGQIPPITLDIRNGHQTHVDFFSPLQPGDVAGLRRIANEWIDGRLGQLRVLGTAEIPIKSGIFSLGKQVVQRELLFANKGNATIPEYKIQKLIFHELESGMAVNVSLLVKNDYPVDFTVPPLRFDLLVENCDSSVDPYIMVAHAATAELVVQPRTNVELNAIGVVLPLPPVLTQDCPDSERSPLDLLLGKYMHGQPNTVYVRGSASPSPQTPPWVNDLISDIVVPVPVPGRSLGHLIRNFSLTDTHFSLPNPVAEPGTPESNPRLSAKIRVIVDLPQEMNFNVDVSRVRADADVFYKGQRLGRLDLRKWQHANSTRLEPEGDDKGPALLVESLVEDAPLTITNSGVFTEVVKELVFRGNTVVMNIKAEVDVAVQTVVGNVTINKIPAKGQVPIKPISHAPDSPNKPGDGNGELDPGLFHPRVVDIRIANTSSTGLTLKATVNMTNPTNYSATIPYVDINVIKNGSLLGHVTARDLEIVSGNNSNLEVSATYDPPSLDGPKARIIGRELISQYLSGFNTTLTLRTHSHSFPSNPSLGVALSNFPLEVRVPRLSSGDPPGDGDDDDDDNPDDDDRPHFVRAATMHLFSSTATFLLASPLHHSTLYITKINATAFYQSEPVGRILHDSTFGVPPIEETPDNAGFETPELNVDWSLGSIGYGAVRRALGGTLKLAARATVGVRLGQWEEELWFVGSGIGTKVKI